MSTANLLIKEADPQGADALMLLREAAVEARALYPELHLPGAPWPTNPPTPARGRGIARAILQELEVAAARFGYRTLVLETGYRQLPAMALYESYLASIPYYTNKKAPVLESGQGPAVSGPGFRLGPS